jgi:hypothetical protein
MELSSGRVYAGPRTLVRRGRRGKLPIRRSGDSALKIELYACGVQSSQYVSSAVVWDGWRCERRIDRACSW